MTTESIKEQKQVIFPESFKKILEKLPTAEALKVIEDIGETAWVVDNNNNNNAKHSAFDDRLINSITRLPAEKIKAILDIKE